MLKRGRTESNVRHFTRRMEIILLKVNALDSPVLLQFAHFTYSRFSEAASERIKFGFKLALNTLRYLTCDQTYFFLFLERRGKNTPDTFI